ncbi:MAG: hypothetical protein ABII12_00360 [Planctomycetota bacterium]
MDTRNHVLDHADPPPNKLSSPRNHTNVIPVFSKPCAVQLAGCMTGYAAIPSHNQRIHLAIL